MLLLNYHGSTDNPECISGFVGDDVLQYVMQSTELTTHTSPPSPVSSCYRVSIKKWIVGARASLEGPPQIALCDSPCVSGYCVQLPCDANFCGQETMFNTTSYLNVYEHQPQNASKQFLVVNCSPIYYSYLRCPLVDCIYRPLVAVELSGKYGSSNLHKSEHPMSGCPGDHCDDCTRGFMGVNELRERARYIPSFPEITTNQSFPDLKISEDGFVVKWTFTAQILDPAPGRRDGYPQLLIVSNSTDRVHRLNSSTAVPTEYPNVYESTVTPPVSVKVGDYIAVHNPPADRAAMILMFVRIPPVVPVTITSSKQLPLHPLVHLHIGKNDSCKL